MQAQVFLLTAALLGLQAQTNEGERSAGLPGQGTHQRVVQTPVEPEVLEPTLSEDVPRWAPDTTDWWELDFVREKTYERIIRSYGENDRIAQFLVSRNLCDAAIDTCTIRIHIRFLVHQEEENGPYERVLHFAAVGPRGIVSHGFTRDVVGGGQARAMRHWIRHKDGWKKKIPYPGIQFYQQQQFVNGELLKMVRTELEASQQ